MAFDLAGTDSERNDSLLSPFSVCCRQTDGLLGGRQLSGGKRFQPLLCPCISISQSCFVFQAYNIFACNGILFNHESPRRGENFVTRKITKYLSDVIKNYNKASAKLKLGNLNAYRDWGHAQDYVKAMHLMLQQNYPKDYVIATGQTYSVQEFLDKAFGVVNLDPSDYVEIDPDLFRPAEVDVLRGDWSKAERELGWKPKTHFTDLVKKMVSNDIEILKK